MPYGMYLLGSLILLILLLVLLVSIFEEASQMPFL